jgi:hypothetical protein
MKLAIAMCAGVLLAACTGQVGDDQGGGGNGKSPVMEFPSDYRNWQAFVLGVQRPEAGTLQIRDIYVNSVGTTVKDGNLFPPGTVFAMDLWKAKVDANMQPILDADGNMQKGDLAKTYVMGKDLGWNVYTTPKPTGDWLYFAFDSTKTMLTDSTSACVDCHLKLADMTATTSSATDWVFGYSTYFGMHGATVTGPLP